MALPVRPSTVPHQSASRGRASPPGHQCALRIQRSHIPHWPIHFAALALAAPKGTAPLAHQHDCAAAQAADQDRPRCAFCQEHSHHPGQGAGAADGACMRHGAALWSFVARHSTPLAAVAPHRPPANAFDLRLSSHIGGGQVRAALCNLLDCARPDDLSGTDQALEALATTAVPLVRRVPRAAAASQASRWWQRRQRDWQRSMCLFSRFMTGRVRNAAMRKPGLPQAMCSRAARVAAARLAPHTRLRPTRPAPRGSCC